MLDAGQCSCWPVFLKMIASPWLITMFRGLKPFSLMLMTCGLWIIRGWGTFLAEIAASANLCAEAGGDGAKTPAIKIAEKMKLKQNLVKKFPVFTFISLCGRHLKNIRKWSSRVALSSSS